MARIILTLLGVSLLFNAAVFLLVAFDEPDSASSSVGALDQQMAKLGRQLTELSKKMQDLAKTRSTLTQLSKKIDAVSRKVDTVSKRIASNRVSVRPRRPSLPATCT